MSNDVISRKEAIELLAKMPNVDKKTGHWNIRFSPFSDTEAEYSCSECGFVDYMELPFEKTFPTNTTDLLKLIDHMHYCPSCGVFMKGGE